MNIVIKNKLFCIVFLLILKYDLGGLLTVIDSDGKPTHVPANSLNMSGGVQGGVAGFASSSSIAAGICLRFYKKL